MIVGYKQLISMIVMLNLSTIFILLFFLVLVLYQMTFLVFLAYLVNLSCFLISQVLVD